MNLIKLKELETHKISVIGGGSWATALIKLLGINHQYIKWWVHRPETVDYIRQYRHNPKYLSSVEIELPPTHISHDLPYIIKDAEWVLIAVPSAYFKETVRDLTEDDFRGKNVISAIKGIIQPENLLVSEFLHQRFNIPYDKIINISGPCHAEEVASEKLSYLTFSSTDVKLARQTSTMFQCRFLKTMANDDIIGTEYASVLKNVYALAAGISVGLDYGDNFRAVLISYAMHEMELFLKKVKVGTRNILAPAYLGDTMVTAYSQFSRNRAFGVMIGKGYTIKSAILELNMVAEGYYATLALKHISDNIGIKLPILDAVYNILYGKISPVMEMQLLTEEFK